MQPKNLGWKFLFLGLLIVLSVYSIWAKGLRQGIDLKGGHVLTFEVQTQGAEADSELIAKVIAVLKKRIDPNGLFMLEWRPVGQNRFEVRMPLGSDKAVQYKQEYLRALDALQAGNIRRSEVLEVTAEGPQRQRIIDDAAKADPRRAEALRKVIATNNELLKARKAVADLTRTKTTPAALAKAEAALDDAGVDYDQAVGDVLNTNISVERLGQILSLYVAGREVRALPAAEVKSRRTAMSDQVKQLDEQFPARAKEIGAVVAAYKRWSEERTGLDDPADLKRMVAAAGVLEFRIAPTLPVASGGEMALKDADYQKYLDELREEGPLAGRNRNEPYQWFPVRTGEDEDRLSSNLVIGKYAGKKYLLLCNQEGRTMVQQPGAKGWSLTNSRRISDDRNRPAVSFNFDPRGANFMGQLTESNKGNFMAILLDDEVYSAPVIRSTISSNGMIEGNFTVQQVDELVRTLNAGSLQGRVNDNPVSEKTIAPSIGEDNRKAGLRAAFWATLVIVAFMMIYYMAAGSVADAAMLLNILLTLGVMSFVDAVFTLPGIAGLTLAAAMAVDANVLIYERLREEQAKCLSIRLAFQNAYKHAFTAIFDSNITTIIAAMILGWVGTEEVKGSAITLGLGVLFNLFTAVSVTRWVFQSLMEANLLKTRVRMLRLIGVPNIDWMGKRRIFWAFTVAISVVGLIALFHQGKDILGIEFSSGTEAAFSIRQGAMIPAPGGKTVPPQREIVEKDLIASADRLAEKRRKEADGLSAKLASVPEAEKAGLAQQIDRDRAEAAMLGKFDPKVETLLDRDKVERLMERFDANGDGTISLAEWTARGGDGAYFKDLDANGDGKITRAEAQARLPERSYQVATTVADAELVRQVVTGAFPQSLDMTHHCDFALKKDGALARLGVALNARDEGVTHITPELVGKVNSAVRARFTDFVGGAMFVVDNVSPPLSEEDLADRIRTMSLQPDFSEFAYNRIAVVGMSPTADGKSFASFAVLAHSDSADYISRPDEWRRFAGNELKLLTAALQRERSLDSISSFDPAMAGEATQRAVIACVLSWMAIIVYLWIRFGQARWGLAAVVCLVHDVIISVGMVALSGWLCHTAVGRALLITPVKIDMTVIAALLTIIGYSVNDTIVVFDRIRENRGKLKTIDETTINHAINQTLSRTLLTSASVVMALFIMYAIGGAGIHPFCYAMLPGVLVGTFSSIAVAAPMLLGFRTAFFGRRVRKPQPVPVPVRQETQNKA